MAKKLCCCSNFLSCFSCFSATNSHHASPSSAPPNAASLGVETQTALSSSDKEGTSSGISAAVNQVHDSQLPECAASPDEGTSSSGISAAVNDSQLPECASVGGTAPSKVPSPPPCTQIEPARGSTSVPTEVPKDDILQDPASKQSTSEADASGNEKVGEGGSSSSRNDDATLQTVPDLSSQIVKYVDGESVDLDGLMKHITHLLEIIEEKISSPAQLQRRAEDYFPKTSKIVSKLKMFLFEAKDVIPGEAIKTAVSAVLKGMVSADLITTPFVVVASILERFGDVGDNKNECISLLKEMIFLAKLVKQFQERPQLKGDDGISGVSKEANELIVEGSILCCTQMKSSKFSKFWAASVNKEVLSKFRQKLRDMYTHMNAQMGIRLYDVNAPRKTRLSRGIYSQINVVAMFLLLIHVTMDIMFDIVETVGLEEPVKEVLELLEWGSQRKAVAVMLHAFGGMGKSTLADAVFSRADFEECKYSEVRLFKDIESKADIIESQKRILNDLMGTEETFPEIRTYEIGQQKLGSILENVTAFIYIDNVLGENELSQLLPVDLSKAKKLRLLVTARDRNVGRAFPRKTSLEIYSMKRVLNSTAMKFLKSEVLDDMEEKLNSSEIDNLIDRCGGVPLMLTLVAKVLRFEKDKRKAYNRVMQDQHNVKGQIFERIGAEEKYFFAYDSLPDKYKDPFLDVCCFFKGWDWDTVADIVGEDDLDILKDRALVTKSVDSTASVHDVILTIGQQKAKGTRFKEFEKFRDHDDEKEIKGIWFGENKDPWSITASKLDMCKSLRVVDLGNLIKVEGQCSKIFENLVFFKGGITRLPFDVSKIENIKYLKYEPGDLTLPKMPSSLRHMEFDGRLQSPAFQISSACLQQLGNLRILRLVKFPKLKKLPERIGDHVKVLQELSLSHCESLEELPTSISRLQFLRLLRMDYCSSLRELPEKVSSFQSLKVLRMDHCSSLGRLAKDFGSLKSLQELNLEGCLKLRQLGEDFGSLNSLQELNLEGCTGLAALPSNFEMLSSLRSLNLSSCENLEDLPHGLGKLSSLVALSFRNCPKLRSIPDSIGQLKLTVPSMDMSDCSSLTELPDGFCNLSFITSLTLARCKSLHSLPTRFRELATLTSLTLRECSSLKGFPESFGQLRCLELLAMQGCTSLEELCNDFHCLTSLQFLTLNACASLKKLPEYFHCLPSLNHLDLSFCYILEGKSMDNVLKIKTIKTVDIEGSGMLVDRWAEIQRESDQSSPFQEKVLTGQNILKENLEKNMLSQLELLFSEGPEKPFHPSAPLLVLVYDMSDNFNNNFPWPLIEETIDDIQIKFEMLYIGDHFDKLPPKAKNIIVGHVDDAFKQEALNLYATILRVLGELDVVEKYEIEFIQISMVEDGGGGTGKCRPCWKHMRKREMEEFLVCNCRKYLQLKQLAETSQESSTELLRELFAAGEAQTFTFLKAPSGSSKPALSCTAEDLKGKTILLEIRPLNVGYDHLRLASLIQLYNAKKETFNLEIISIPLVHRSSSSTLDVFEKFSRDIPWLVIQNPWAIPSAVKYFLMELFAPDELDAVSPNGIKIIESNGRIFTPSKPVMGLLDRWGAKAYPFTVQKIEELKKEEWNQMETMPTLEFLFNGLESVSDQVKEMMLHQKVVCLYGGSESENTMKEYDGTESENTMKEFTALIRNAFISVKDNIHIIYIPRFKLKAREFNQVTDAITWSYQPLEMSTLAQAEMEGMLLLNPSQHDAFRFWRRIALLEEEMPEMYNSDTEQEIPEMMPEMHNSDTEQEMPEMMPEMHNSDTEQEMPEMYNSDTEQEMPEMYNSDTEEEMPEMYNSDTEQKIPEMMPEMHNSDTEQEMPEMYNSDTEQEMPEMYNGDTEQISAIKKIFQCWNNENPWMILMDEEGKTITESGRKIVWSCKGSLEDEAKGLIELLIKGSPEQRKEALYKLEQWPDDSN